MELGEKLRQARLDAGMSQRQLCGEEITRNMLSQIENGSAQPSVATLRFLAGRLGKPMGYFLEEEAVVSANGAIMDGLRLAYDREDWERAAKLLQDYRQPDPVYDREMGLLRELVTLSLAETAIREGRQEYARGLLEKKPESVYLAEALNRRRLLLLGRLGGNVAGQLPSIDEELMLRAEYALEVGELRRAAALLDGAEDQNSSRWNLLRGRVFLAAEEYEKAAQCLLRAEGEYPAQTVPALEQCYRELGDFEKAYRYACKTRQL